jgi:hypothetical protein
MEVREKYYKCYKNGRLRLEGSLEDCTEMALHSLDDECAEIYEVIVTENKISF